MAEGELSSLKESLLNQYVMIEKLYDELEEEREASATAVSEALSMILRLQREKAAEKMEACQYKRMAEERMHHSEQCLANLEEEMQRKDLEITSLKYRLRAYKHKLSTVGISSIDIDEIRNFAKSSALRKKMSSMRRNISLPVRLNQLNNEVDALDEDSHYCPTGRLTSRENGDCSIKLEEHSEIEKPGSLQDAVLEHCDSNLKQGEETKEISWTRNVEEIGCESIVGKKELQTSGIADSMESGLVSRTCSWYSTVSGDGTRMKLINGEGALGLPSQSEESEKFSGCDALSGSWLGSESNENTAQSTAVHDIYEVPEDRKRGKLHETFDHALEESVLKVKNLIATGGIPEETMDCILKDDDWLNKALIYAHHENRVSKLRKGNSMNHGKKFCMPMRTASMNYRVMDPPKNEITEYLNDVGLLKSQLQRLEKEDATSMGDAERSQEQLKLLKEIYKQLNAIESSIKKSNMKKCTQKEESKLVSVMEAVLSFSI